VVLRGNLIIAREDETVKFPATVQGIGCFDGPLVNFTVERNVVCVNHYHGISLYDAQGCTIRDNVCFTRWGGKLRPWIMLGSKKKQAAGNTVRDNFAHSYSFTADRQVTAENNAEVTGQVFAARFNELADLIEQKYGRTHPVANLPRVKRD
jgi:parallel beta-helix repeat protein